MRSPFCEKSPSGRRPWGRRFLFQKLHLGEGHFTVAYVRNPNFKSLRGSFYVDFSGLHDFSFLFVTAQ